MTRTPLAPDDEPDPQPTATAPVGAVREGLRGYRERRDALLDAARADIDRAGHRPRRTLAEIGISEGPFGMTGILA